MVQPHGDDHRVGGTSGGHVAQQVAEGHVVLEIHDVPVRLPLAGVEVEHQQRAGQRQEDEQVERDPAHAPREVVAHGLAVDARRVQVQEDVRQNGQRPVPVAVVELVPEDGLPDLALLHRVVGLLVRRELLPQGGHEPPVVGGHDLVLLRRLGHDVSTSLRSIRAPCLCRAARAPTRVAARSRAATPCLLKDQTARSGPSVPGFMSLNSSKV